MSIIPSIFVSFLVCDNLSQFSVYFWGLFSCNWFLLFLFFFSSLMFVVPSLTLWWNITYLHKLVFIHTGIYRKKFCKSIDYVLTTLAKRSDVEWKAIIFETYINQKINSLMIGKEWHYLQHSSFIDRLIRFFLDDCSLDDCF